MCHTSKSVVERWVIGQSDPTKKYRLMLADLFDLSNRRDDGFDIDEYVDAFLELVPIG